MITILSKPRLLIAAYSLISAASLWLRLRTPLSARGEAMHDDALFVRQAYNLLHHHWLGTYDNLTLAKGMFFPLFLACTSWAGLPLRLGEHAIYLVAAGVVAAFVAHYGRRPWLGVVLFAALAFNPILWGLDFAFVLREGLYIGLTLAVASLYAELVFLACRPLWHILLSLLLGVVLGAFWLTREEGIWILPTLASLAFFGVGRNFFASGRIRPEGRRNIALLMACTALVITVAVACNVLVASINRHEYGVFETVEFKSRNFVRGYSALAGLDPALGQSKVVATSLQRQLAYSVSPAARELQPYLDGPMGEDWRKLSCQQSLIPSGQCKEVLAGWFMWELRDAVTAAGHADSAQEADAFYGRMADEIGRACAEHRIVCVDRPPSLSPPFRWHDVRNSWRPMLQLTKLAFTLDPRVTIMLPNSGTPEQLAIITSVFGKSEMAASSPEHALKRQHKAPHYIVAFCVWLYGWTVPFLSLVAFLGLVSATLLRQGTSLPVYALTVSSLVAVTCRIALLAYLDATSIPAANELYISAATPFVLVFAITGTLMAYEIWRSRVHQPRSL